MSSKETEAEKRQEDSEELTYFLPSFGISVKAKSYQEAVKKAKEAAK